MSIVGLSPVDFARLQRMIRWFEAQRPVTRLVGGDVPNWQHVRCTGPVAADDGSGSGAARYWPGTIVIWDAAAEAEITKSSVWLYCWNDFGLRPNTVYDGRQSGYHTINDDRRTVFTISAAAAFPETIADGSGAGSDDGSGSGSGAGCVSGIPISDLIRCNDGKTQIRDACLDWTDGHIVLRDGNGNIIGGG